MKCPVNFDPAVHELISNGGNSDCTCFGGKAHVLLFFASGCLATLAPRSASSPSTAPSTSTTCRRGCPSHRCWWCQTSMVRFLLESHKTTSSRRFLHTGHSQSRCKINFILKHFGGFESLDILLFCSSFLRHLHPVSRQPDGQLEGKQRGAPFVPSTLHLFLLALVI